MVWITGIRNMKSFVSTKVNFMSISTDISTLVKRGNSLSCLTARCTGARRASAITSALCSILHTVIELSPICKQLAQPVLLGSSQFISHITNCDERLRSAADKLFISLASSQTYAPFQVISATFDLIGALLENYTEDRMEKSRDTEMRSVSRIKDVLRLIRNHYHEEITLDDLANSAHMNKRYLCRYFREVMGRTPMAVSELLPDRMRV